MRHSKAPTGGREPPRDAAARRRTQPERRSHTATKPPRQGRPAERIRLGTSVTVLSTQDPVRLYADFATLDAESGGRAQVIVGRGSLTDSFPLFGLDLADSEELFEEKLDLLMRLLRRQPVTWSGNFRPALTNQFVSPPIPEGHIPTWVGVGGSHQSVIRAARFGLPLMLAISAGKPDRFAPYVELYKRVLEQHGQLELPVGLHSLGFVAETDDDALSTQWPYYREQFEWAPRERGWRPPTYESTWPRSITARCTSARRRLSRTESQLSSARSV
jgi:alkanesulfonate monooxygenase SsuD/methylene tetrahydromethanopterin reductase-like flavin-dependent oxidoreductase (luciferase family)